MGNSLLAVRGINHKYIVVEMGMGRDTFYRHINALVAAGVVEKKQSVGNAGKFGRTIYRLTHEVVISDFPITQNKDTVIGITAHKETNNNILNSNNINNNSNKKYMCVQPEVDTITKSTPKEKRARFIPPTEEEVNQYCLEKGYALDAQRFVDFYECKGWMVGKNKMKNWKAAVRTWANKNQGVVKNRPKQQPEEPEEKRIDLWSEE